MGRIISGGAARDPRRARRYNPQLFPNRPPMPIALIESLDHEGRGVAHVEGKTVFVDGALPLERVEFATYRRKPNYELAQTVAILRPSAWRTEPGCRYFGICGGCSMQHLDARAQAATKQRVLDSTFSRLDWA